MIFETENLDPSMRCHTLSTECQKVTTSPVNGSSLENHQDIDCTGKPIFQTKAQPKENSRRL